eukprot:4248150-Alexandrium_andersonii.AAC.1
MGRASRQGASRMGAAPVQFAPSSRIRQSSGDSARCSKGTAELPWGSTREPVPLAAGNGPAIAGHAI